MSAGACSPILFRYESFTFAVAWLGLLRCGMGPNPASVFYRTDGDIITWLGSDSLPVLG